MFWKQTVGGEGWGRETVKKASLDKFYNTSDGGPDLCGSQGSSKEWSDSGYGLKVQQIGSPERWCVWCEESSQVWLQGF